MSTDQTPATPASLKTLEDEGHSDGVSKGHDVERQVIHDNSNSEAAEDEHLPKDPLVVDWDGPDDPANPLNWPLAKKVTAIGIVSLITLLSPLASTIISPATADVMATFGSTNETLGVFVTSVYLLGYSFGPLVFAPLSELYGRAVVYNGCNFMFLIFSICCAISTSLNSLIVFRLFAGIAASCPMALGAGTVADMVPLEKRGLAMAAWIAGPLVGPTFGPLGGAYLAEAKGWRWIFWLVSIIAGVVCIATLLLMHESYAYVILDRKTRRLQKETRNFQLRSALHSGRSPKEFFEISIFRPVRMLFLSPIVFSMSLYMATVYGYLYLMFTTFPRVFQGQYGFSNGSVGLTYVGVGVGSFLGLALCGLASDRLVKSLTRRNGGTPKPEYRLPVMFAGVFIVPLGLFLYGWSAEEKVHWIVPIIGAAIFGGGMFTLFMPMSTYLLDTYTVYAASVSAAATVFRSLLGALLPLAGNKMYDALGLGWGNSLLGFIAVAFVPVPFIFWRFGERIRNSRLSKIKF